MLPRFVKFELVLLWQLWTPPTHLTIVECLAAVYICYHFYQTQVYLGSDLWVASVCH